MNRLEHPVTPEELMAFVDGELDTTQIARVEDHVEGCTECMNIVTDAKNVSLQMSEWLVGEAPARIADKVLAKVSPSRGIAWAGMRRWVYGFAGAFAVLFIIFTITIPSMLRSRQAAPGEVRMDAGPVPVPQSQVPQSYGQQGQAGAQYEREARAEQARPAAPAGRIAPAAIQPTSEQMVIRNLKLTIITKEFDAARAKLDDLLRQSQGYAENLSARGEAGTARSLSATLRIPAPQVDSVLAELKKLGRVMDESQNSQEITSQYVDLVARINNARNSEQRLLGLLRERAGNLNDVVQMEREISSVRENIERMEAQQKDLNGRVQFANIQLELSEEYHAELTPPTAPSTKTQLRNAWVEGIQSAKESMLDIALFFLRNAPVLTIWFVLLGSVVVILWRYRLSRPM